MQIFRIKQELIYKKSKPSNLEKFIAFVFLIVIIGIMFYCFQNLYDTFIEKPIMDSILKEPFILNAKITEKHSYKVSSFGLEFDFKGKKHEISITVSNELYGAYREGDSISITISKSHPTYAILTSEFKKELKK